MTHAEPAARPVTPAAIDGRPLPAVLADSVERFITAVFGTWPASTPEAGPTHQHPEQEHPCPDAEPATTGAPATTSTAP